MGTLIILGMAVLGGLACSKQTLYQSWIFLVNLAFSVYLALLLAPLVKDLAQPSLNLSRELAPYLTPAAMLVLFLVLIILFYKITDAVIPKDFEDFPLPGLANKIGAMGFAALSGAILAAFLVSCFCLMPFSQNILPDRTALADSGRRMLSTMVRTVNGFSLQGTSFEAERTLKELTAYTPPPPQTQNKRTEPENAVPVSQKDEAPPVKKRKIEKIDGKPVVVPKKPMKPDGGSRKAEPEETLESPAG